MSDYLPVGIDLGTTYSCIGYWRDDKVILIRNSVGDKLTPSIVLFIDDKCLVGEQAQKYLDPKGVKVYSTKRFIGRTFSDKKLSEDIKYFNYKIINKDNFPVIEIDKEKNIYQTPVDIASLILKKLIDSANKELSQEIKKVVISVPAIFNDSQREATKRAAEKIGLEVIRIINEPTAAALAYAFKENNCFMNAGFKNSFAELLRENRKHRQSQNNGDDNPYSNRSNVINFDNKEKTKKILVFDLGGGTYDLAILELKNNEYEVLSKYTDEHLGGDDFDLRIMDYCLKQFGVKNIENARENKLIDKVSGERLKDACELVKRLLSTEQEANLKINNFYGKIDLNIHLTRNQFEKEICKDLLNRFEKTIRELLEGIKLIPDDIYEVLLVGGSSKIPYIKEILKGIFKNSKINDSISPDEIVGYGATIQAAMILSKDVENRINNHNLKNFKLIDITPFSLGTDVLNKISRNPELKIIIKKGTKIPCSAVSYYKTTEDNQENMLVGVYEGDSKKLEDNNLLGEFEIKNLPKRPKGKVTCTIDFKIDLNNILTVTGRESTEGQTFQITIKTNRHIDIGDKNKLKDVSFDENENNNEYEKSQNFMEYAKSLSLSYPKFDDEGKYLILSRYENAVKETLSEIVDKNNLDNEYMMEKYYLYVYQIFESYVEMFFLNDDIKKKYDLENKIKEKILNFLNEYDFKNRNIYYIKKLINLFEETKNKSSVFYRFVLEGIKIFNDIALSYLNKENKKFSRYYSKLYFTESITLLNKYFGKNNNESFNELKYSGINIDEINFLREICITNLEEINDNAKTLLEEPKNLFEPDKIVASVFNEEVQHSGYNQHNNKFLYFKRVNEEYTIVLDKYKERLEEIELLLKENPENENLQEQKAICEGSIVKIKIGYLGDINYSDCLKYIKDCNMIGQKLKKDKNSCAWYKNTLSIEKLLDEKEEFEKVYRAKLDEFKKKSDEIFKQGNKIDYIKYIKENSPYKGYDKNNEEVKKLDWSKNNLELIIFLRKKYNLEKYSKRSPREKFEYLKTEDIVEKLTDIENQLK